MAVGAQHAGVDARCFGALQCLLDTGGRIVVDHLLVAFRALVTEAAEGITAYYQSG